jgi:hypothetical protein
VSTSGRNQVVDTPAALEFMREIAERVNPEDLAAISTALSDKSRRLAVLAGGGARHLDEAAWREVLRSCFPSRRRAGDILERVGKDRLGAAADALFEDGEPLATRLSCFNQMLCDFRSAQADLAFELLHFAAPDRYWLWARWIWDPAAGTGALPLLVGDEVDLGAGLLGAVPGCERVAAYETVGEASAMVAGTVRALGLSREGPFDLDVFLACVYGVYMYTVLRMRMTQEFNRIVPELPQLVSRLLGVHHREVTTCP